MAADSYSRVTGNIGVAMATSGLEQLTYYRNMLQLYDSVPTLMITGNASPKDKQAQRELGRLVSRNSNSKVVKPITKYAISYN